LSHFEVVNYYSCRTLSFSTTFTFKSDKIKKFNMTNFFGSRTQHTWLKLNAADERFHVTGEVGA